MSKPWIKAVPAHHAKPHEPPASLLQGDKDPGQALSLLSNEARQRARRVRLAHAEIVGQPAQTVALPVTQTDEEASPQATTPPMVDDLPLEAK